METAQLVLSAQDGDDLAIDELLLRYYPRLERIVRARVGPALRARVEIDDILQETFLQAVLRLSDFEMRSDSAFLDWLATIGTNQVLKAAEHHGRERRSASREEPLLVDMGDAVSARVRELTGRVSGPLTRALYRERDELLLAALDQLSGDHREVLVLRHLVGMPFEEITARLDRPTDAATRELYRRSRAQLAIALRRNGVRPDSDPGH